MKILTLIWFELIDLARDKIAWIIMLLMPIILTFILVNINDNRDESVQDSSAALPIGFYVEDKSELAANFIAELKKNDSLKITETNIDDLADMVRNSDLIAGFIINKDFSNAFETDSHPEIGVLRLTAEEEYYMVLGEIDNVFTKIVVDYKVRHDLSRVVERLNYKNKAELLENINNIVTKTMEENPIINVKKIKEKEIIAVDQVAENQHYTIGMIVMFVMFTVMTGAGIILKEKNQNTWFRLLSTPTGKTTILFGKMLGTFITGWIQIGILILFGRFFLGIYLGRSILLTFFVFTVYMLSVTGLSIFISIFIKSYTQLTPVLSLIIICTSMLSGCYWPIWLMPDFMQKLAVIFPQYWAIRALEETIVKGSSIEAVLLPLIVLIGLGTGFFLLSIIIGNIIPKFYRTKQKTLVTEKKVR